MKIAVGTNLFGTGQRQELAMQSLVKCKEIMPAAIDLFNLQFESGKDLTENAAFKTLRCLKKTGADVCGGTRGLPIVREMFDSLAALGYDYFCFVNSDIIVCPAFFQEIIDNAEKHDTFIASRLAIEGDIKDLSFSIKLNDPTSSPVKNSHYQVSGFDAFTIKSEWWYRHREIFPEYVYAVVYWDTHYATLLMKNAGTYMQNKVPTIFHVIHADASSAQCAEFTYNYETFAKGHPDQFELWHRFFFGVLVKRGVENNFLWPAANELELEKLYFRPTL